MIRTWTVWVALALSACAHSKIPNTNIDDTDENRAILGLVEQYKAAMEARDAGAILSMVSNKYYEDNGNSSSSDDYNYVQLQQELMKDFERTKQMQLVIRVDAIEVEDDDAFAELYYTVRAQNEYASGLKWETGSDRTRLKFSREKDRWMIVSGL